MVELKGGTVELDGGTVERWNGGTQPTIRLSAVQVKGFGLRSRPLFLLLWPLFLRVFARFCALSSQ
jgi:hypothetical protein